MTVELETSRVVHVGDGTTGPYTIPFYFIENEDIKALKVTIADGTEVVFTVDVDFTLEGEGEEAGGEMTLTESLSSDYRLVIYRDPAPLQETRYPRNDPFPAESHERVADRLTMIAQRLTELLARSVRQPDGDTADIDTLPAKETRASKYLAFDADGNPVATAGTSESAVISTYSETLLDDTSAGDWLTTLGISAFFQTLLSAASASALNTLLGMSTFFKTLLGASSASAFRTLIDVFSTDEAWPTGRVRVFVGTTAATGWVLLDDGTIGNASSGATTRANADTEDLFVHLWTMCADTECAVSTGRGASAAADFAANKTIALPKALGRALAVYGAGAGLTSRALGLSTGTETHQLTQAETPVKSHAHTASSSGSFTGYTTESGTESGPLMTTTGGVGSAQVEGVSVSTTVNAGADATATAHQNMQPTTFMNAEIKL